MKNWFAVIALLAIVVIVIAGSGCTSNDQSDTQSESGTVSTHVVTSTKTESSSTSESTLTPTPTPEPIPVTITIDETETNFTYSPGWLSQENSGATGGSWIITGYGAYGYSDIKADLTFTGTEISLIYLKGPFGGIAEIEIDGESYPSIDMYSSMSELAEAKIASGLENTEHILTIRASEESNPDVTLPPTNDRPVITIDAVEVTYLTTA